MLPLYKRFYGHLHTINSHRRAVMKHCFMVGIPWQGIKHDLSKYMPTEFIAGVMYFEGFRSPNERERETNGYSLAWIHHKGRNRHHFEYWTDYEPITKIMKPVVMPTRFVAEMFCDRVAASKIYNKGKYTDDMPLEYFLKAKGRRIIHPETSDLIESLLRMLAEEGEAVTFEYVRNMVSEDKALRRQQRRAERQNRKDEAADK